MTDKALATIASGPYARLLDLTRPRLERYAELHGWELIVLTEADAHGRPPTWAKVPLLADLLRRYPLVAFIDADAVIVDDSLDLATELRRRRDFYLVEHTHPAATDPPGIEVTANAGVMMLRATRWMQRFLAAVWAQEDLIEHRWCENAAMMRLLGYRLDPQPAGRERRTRWLRRVRFIDVAWNSMPWQNQASPSPRIVHFGGRPLEERAAAIAGATDQ